MIRLGQELHKIKKNLLSENQILNQQGSSLVKSVKIILLAQGINKKLILHKINN